jgi:formylglycine-generating enzyme required for sulfatase activity
VGRFRQFVSACNGGYVPPAGSGKHTHLNGGQGLADSDGPGSYETGWQTTDNGNIAPTDTNLACQLGWSTWTTSAGGQEDLPIGCVNWYEAYAFCIWDGGFLPSEAEWRYVVAGGSAELEYPWGLTDPGTGSQYAIYGCYYPSGLASCIGVGNMAPVGAATLGASLWGQLDMAGEEETWNLDGYPGSAYGSGCVDCASLSSPSTRSIAVGGYFALPASQLLPSLRGRGGGAPTMRRIYVGVRCARTP